MASKRMHRGLVALSASAVAAVYMAGYVRTQPADAAIGASPIDPVAAAVASVAPAQTPTPSIVATPPPGRAPTAPAPPIARAPTQGVAPTPAPAVGVKTGAYKDGTFTGTGSSRRGDVWVSVDVQGGRIANVTITRSTLQYPLRDIAALPGEVVDRQSAQVDIVSRATYSSQAFRTAVAQALGKAAAA